MNDEKIISKLLSEVYSRLKRKVHALTLKEFFSNVGISEHDFYSKTRIVTRLNEENLIYIENSFNQELIRLTSNGIRVQKFFPSYRWYCAFKSFRISENLKWLIAIAISILSLLFKFNS